MKSRFQIFLAALVLLAWTSAVGARTPQVPVRIRQLMQDRQYGEAVKAIDETADDAKVDQDYLAYLKGRALHLQEKYDAAIAAYGTIEKDFPDSPWARRARFAQGVSYTRKGDFRAAELIYRKEAQYLLSVDRKQELAGIYLEFADAYFKPPKEDQKPDYKKALEFYGQALQLGPKDEKRQEIELQIGKCFQALADWDKAIASFSQFIDKYLDFPIATEARFRLGEARLKKGDRVGARRTWQDLLDRPSDAASPRVAEAAFDLSLTYGIPAPETVEQLSLGVASLRSFLKKYPDHELASLAHLRIAQSFQKVGRSEDAVAGLVAFLADARYADRLEVPDARYLLGNAYKMQGKFDEAIAVWREFLAKHPTHKLWSTTQREIIAAQYLTAHALFAGKKYDAARSLWSEFLREHPLDGRNPGILYLFGQMRFLQQQWNEAIADWQRLVSKYPDSEEASHAQYMVAVTLEEQLGKLDESLEAYRKVAKSSYQARAKQRIARLTAKSLRIETSRVFRSDEMPRVKLETRNIESVSVRVYRIDLETYFRKMRLAKGVEQLDTALIDPDSEFEFKIPDYRAYAHFDQQIEVPVPGAKDDGGHAGVMAVTVSSKTLEATTLLLRSDLDVIVKSSRDEVLVLAQNMLTGQPWPNVRILASNGELLLVEGATNSQGVFHQAIEKLESSRDVRVFAVAAGHVASSNIDLRSVGKAQGLANKGYIYTDRPAYRPGQLVHVRGVIRKANDDVYVVEKGKSYHLNVFDNRNRVLYETEVKLNSFGSFHDNFQLPELAPQGVYRVLVSDRDRQNYQGTFVVQDYKLDPIRVEVDVPRTVYYRGEEIAGKIKVSYYYGAPLAGREVRYGLQGGRTVTAVTDDQGEIEFQLPTRDYREAQPLVLSVVLSEHNLQTGKVFFLARQAFSLTAKTARDVYLAGETFELEVTALNPESKPVETQLAVKVFKRTRVAGRVAEVSVAEYSLATDQQGRAWKTLKLDEGGEYLLRVEGIDRFQNPVSFDKLVTISDDKDTVRLRILADRHTFRVGDTAKIRLHWREKPALALVTFQGARILDYQLVQLRQGVNALDVPITAKLAPNFEFAVAVMTDLRDAPSSGKLKTRFHVASSPFKVQRELNVTLDWPGKTDAKTTYAPGDKVNVSVKTADPQGKPVSAELSLALIEQSLLDRFAYTVAGIPDFFRGAPRKLAVRTDSSITFSYKPRTRAINSRLLAEADRRAVAAEETERLSMLRGGTGLPDDLDFDNDGIRVWSANAPNAHGDVPNAPIAGGNASQGRPAAVFGITRGDAGPSGRSQVLARLGEVQAGDLVPRSAQKILRGREAGYRFNPFAAGQQLAVPALANAGPVNFPSQSDWAVPQTNRWNYLVVNKDGSSFNLELAPDEKEAVAGQLAEQGAVLLPRPRPDETGFWNPAVTTGADGTASVTVILPSRSTAWKLLAQGVTTNTLAGQAAERLVAKKDLFGQLKVPPALTDGDTVEIVASIHNDVLEEGTIRVALVTAIGGKSTTEQKTVAVTGKGIEKLVFTRTIDLPVATGPAGGEVQLTLIVQAGDRRDVVRRTVPIQPYGMAVYALKGGTAESDVLAVVQPPEEMALDAAQLQVIVGPTVQQSLMDVVFGRPTWCQIQSRGISALSDSAGSDLMAALALQRLVGKTRDAGSPRAVELDRCVRSTISLLVAAQNDDGGWSWSVHARASDPYATARIVWGLSLARRSGYSVAGDGFSKAVNYLRTVLAKSPITDYETKAVLAHALAVAGSLDFPLANQLFRNRQRLSPAGLAHLTLAFVAMDRKQTAGELLSVLGKRDLDKSPARAEWLACNQAPSELHALYAVALQNTVPGDSRLAAQVDWLMAHRTGYRWSPDKTTGPAMLALCQWQATSQYENEKYGLEVFVNDKRVQDLSIDKGTGTQTISVPAELLVKGKQQIRFNIKGRGRYTYQCVLSGFVPADKLRGTTSDWSVGRYYEPANLEMDGKTVPRGFSNLSGSYRTFRNQLLQLPVGRRGHVGLVVHRHRVPANTPQQRLEYLVVTEPLPAGATVVEGSVQGDFERYEVTPGAIVFYLAPRAASSSIHYQIHGYLPGKFRTAPTTVRNAYRADQIAVAKPGELRVLPIGAKSEDKYRLTPVELFELGKRSYAKHDYTSAAKYLGELFANWNLQSEPLQETMRMLLDVHLETGPAAKVVQYFEIIIEKYPDLEIPFANLLKVGDAYHEIGEYERSYLVFRAAVEASFMRESRIAGFLQQQNEFVRSIDVMSTLLREYPPESYVAAATYGLAQQVYGKAADAASDERLRKRKVTRVDLIRQAWAMLDDFLAAHADDPAADEASFSLANAILELELYDQTIQRCRQFAQRFPKSKYVDSFWYIIGYCHYARGEHQLALEMCQKVAQARHVDETTGRPTDSPNKWRAIYIMGQVYHSLGQAAKAIAQYHRVDERFADARQAIEYFTHKALELPEVVVVRPGKPAQVELKFRNVAKCRVTVYRIDLMKFSLLRRNLGGITKINLAGIRPLHAVTIELGDGKDYRDRTRELTLPLKEEGAYLVVGRGADRYASGLILVSPLTVDVQEDAQSGRVRATVRDVDKNAYVNDVHVKVIGSRNEDFVSGETDLRGIFVADAIQGKSMVIAQADRGRYAFHRGTADLLAHARAKEEAPSAAETAATKAPPATGKSDLLEGVQSGNRGIQMKSQKQLENLFDNKVEKGIGGGFGGGIF